MDPNKPVRLLIIEDNPDDAELIIHGLKRAGFEVDWTRVQTESQFLRGLEELPDLILSDFALPQFDGLRALALIRERGLDIPFILISGTVGEETAVEAMKLGASDYILKDRTARLGQAVERVLEESRLRSVHRLNEGQMRILESALEAAANAIVITNVRGEVEWANPAFSRLTGYPAAEVKGQNMRFLQSGRHEPSFYRALWKTVLAGDVWEGEMINRRKDGTLYPELMTITPIRGSDRRITRFVAIKQDFTERKRLEEELRSTHEKLRQLLTHSPAVLYTLAVQGEAVVPRVISENVTTLLGFSVAEALEPDWFLNQVHPEDRGQIVASFQETLSQGDGFLEFRIRHKQGPWSWVADRKRVIRNDAGHPVEVVGVWTDVTERRAAEEQIRFTEAAQRQSMETQAAILNALPAHVALLDSEGVIQAVNESWRRFGTANSLQSPDSGVGQCYLKICEGAAGEAAAEARAAAAGIRAILRGEAREFSIEYPCHAPAEPRWFRLVATPLSEGGRAGAVVMHINVTQRRQTEISLRDSEERFRQLAENITEVFWVTDPAKNEMLYISPAYETIWGRTCESLRQSPRNWLQAIHPADRERVTAAATSLQTTGQYDEVYRILRPDGSLRWIRDRAYPVLDAAGRAYRIVGTAEDMTERKLADEKLREQATLLDKAQDAILVRDLDHRVLYWNRSAERVYGWTVEEVLGRNVSELLYRRPAEYFAATEKVCSQGEWLGELEQVTKSGKALTVEGRWTLVRNEQGTPTSILCINTDITERKKLEAQFLRAQRMESIGTLAGGIAHDLNNVLAPIMVSVELLKADVQSADGLAMLETLMSCAQRGADLVKQVLTFARGVEGERIEINISHLLRDIRQVVRETFPKDIQVVVEPGKDVWAVLGDPTQLHQVFMNLSVNARDAMPRGGKLHVKTTNLVLDDMYASMNPDSQRGPHVLISFTDTGTGIPPEIRDRIFEPFFTTKEIGKGTGLGLSTVMAIVRSHGGFISLYSELGQGTTFKVYLPARDQTPAAGESAVRPSSLPRGRGECVLVVDDEAGIRELTGKILVNFGYRVIPAANGAEAVALYAQHGKTIDVVLTDMAMPVMDGPATVVALKSLNPAVRIICSSGLTSSESVARTMGADVRHFVAKPYMAELILKALARVLSESPNPPVVSGAFR